MQDRLAIHLRDHLNALIDQYDVRLRTVPHYRNLTPAMWLDLGQHILSLTAECIEANDDRLLIDYLHERAEQVSERGMPPESFQRAVALADEIVAPLTETLAEANFIAHLMSRAQITIWQVAAQKRREAETTLQDGAAYQQKLTRRLRAIIETTDELIKIPDLDTLYRRAVELARDKLGIERCGLFLLDPTQQYVSGTYGTDSEGRTTDERAVKQPIEVHNTINLSKDKLWTVSEAPRTYWKDGQQINAGVGWVVGTVLRGTSGPVGIIYSDAFLSGAPLDQDLQDGFALYCSMLASLIERKRAEGTLRQSEAQLAEALHIAKLAYWEYDVEKDLFLFNDQFYSIFHTTAEREGGYTMSSGQYAQRFVHPDDLAVVGSEIEKALTSTDRHYSRQIDHRILYGDGGVGYISVSINIDRDEQGHILRYYGANQDITERKQAEEAIKEEQQRTQTILETVTVPMIISRLSDSKILYVNQALAQFRHMNLDELMGNRTVDYFVKPDDRNRVAESLRHQSYVNDFETQFRGSGGAVTSVLLSARIINYQNETSVLTTYIDITERKRAEETLRRSEAELAEALQIAKLAHWEYDVAKDLFHFNDQFYAIFHTTAEREGGYQLSSAQYAQRFVYPDDLAVVGSEIEKALTSTDRHYSHQIDHRILYGDGGVGYISVSINIDRDEQGQILRYYGANQDITEQKRNEQQMQETLHELEHLYATVSREGWQTYRQSGRLPAGYRFDQTLIQPADQVWTAEIEQAIVQQALVTSQTADHAVAVAPIKVRGEVIGTLGVYDNPDQPLQPEQLALVESISEQVALALESARLFDQTRQALSEAEQLYNIGRHINTATTLEDLLQAAIAPSIATGSSGAGLWLFDLNDLGQPVEMEYKTAWSRTGEPPLPIGTRLRIENFPSSRLWLNDNGQSTFVSNVARDERIDSMMRVSFQQAQIAATGFMPLLISNRWIGLIIVSWQEPRDFTASEQRMYQAVASQVAVAIENRRLFEQTQHNAERERIVHYIAGQIRNAQSVEQVLRIATQELRVATMASRSVAEIAPRSSDQKPNGNDHGSQPDP